MIYYNNKLFKYTVWFHKKKNLFRIIKCLKELNRVLIFITCIYEKDKQSLKTGFQDCFKILQVYKVFK